MDFLPPQYGGALVARHRHRRRTVAPRTAHRRTATVCTARLAPQCGSASPPPRTVALPQWAQPDLRHSMVARHRHRAPSHCANASYFMEYNAVVIVFIPSSLPLYGGVAPVACFAK